MISGIGADLKLIFMALSLGFWSLLYNSLRLTKNEHLLYCYHSIAVLYDVLSLVFLFLSPSIQIVPKSDETAECNPFGIMYMVITWGYVSFFILSSIADEDLLPPIYFLHYTVLLLLATDQILIENDHCEILIRGICYIELTNPSVRSTWYLNELSKDDSFYAKLFALTIYGTLALIRLVFITYYFMNVHRSEVYSFGSKGLASYFYVMSILLSSNVVILYDKLLRSAGKHLSSFLQ